MAMQKYTVAMFLAVALIAGPIASYAADAGYATSATLAAPGRKAATEEEKLLEDVNVSFKAAMAAAAKVPPADKFKTFEAAFHASSQVYLASAASKSPQLIPQLNDAYKAASTAAEVAAPEDKYEAFVLHLDEALRIIAGTSNVYAVRPSIKEMNTAKMPARPAMSATAAATATADGYKV
ncbi:hypothetical protein ACQ4PT_011060 [Festuca glaucescens]